MTDLANRFVKFDLEVMQAAHQIHEWSQEHADMWHECWNDAAHEAFLAAISSSQAMPVQVDKAQEKAKTQESDGEMETDWEKPAGDSKEDARLKEVRS